MTDFIIIASIVLVLAFFWQLRQMAELSRRFVESECRRQRVQLLAIAMDSARPSFGGTSGLCWKATYIFEFSTDGVNLFQGKITMNAKHIQKINWPIFPEPQWDQAPIAKGRVGGCGGGSCGSGKCH